jgi:hypothetical protein
LFAQPRRGGDQQCVQLVDAGGAGLDGAGTDQVQRADRFGDAIAGLGHHPRAARQYRLGGGVGVQRVGLAPAAALPPVGPVDLDYLYAFGPQVPGQRGAVGPGALYPHRMQPPEGAQPGQQRGIAGRGGRELRICQTTAVHQHHRSVMDVLVGVDAADQPPTSRRFLGCLAIPITTDPGRESEQGACRVTGRADQ